MWYMKKYILFPLDFSVILNVCCNLAFDRPMPWLSQVGMEFSMKNGLSWSRKGVESNPFYVELYICTNNFRMASLAFPSLTRNAFWSLVWKHSMGNTNQLCSNMLSIVTFVHCVVTLGLHQKLKIQGCSVVIFWMWCKLPCTAQMWSTNIEKCWVKRCSNNAVPKVAKCCAPMQLQRDEERDETIAAIPT